jgi:hypothetical protein
MTDFATTYEQFLGMIEDESDRAEVQQHISKMAGAEAQSQEYATAHRDLVRVLKSRAPHVLPTTWREDPRLEDVSKTFHHTELRKDWKQVMEESGVFSFGHLPTFEDIDKHYGEGDSRKHSKTHNAKPTQRVHGNEVGVRHMVVRLAALPKYRNNIEQLAEDLGKPSDTPYRELVQFLGDDEHRQAVQRVYDSAFRGEEAEEAQEGTGLAGENFKLSAGRARGARADEHQDPSVQTRDTAARVTDAREAATERTGEDQSTASIGDLLGKAGDALDSTTREILTSAKSYERYVRGDSVFNAWERDVKREQRKIDEAEARFEASQKTDADVAALAGVNADAMNKVGIYTAALQVRLQEGGELRDAGLTDEQVQLIDMQAKHAVAVASMARPMEYTAQHTGNQRDAGEHERPYGPDEGEGDWSYYGVPMKELRDAMSDLFRPLEAGEAEIPNRAGFQPTKPEKPAEQPAPAERPRRLAAPAAAQPAAATPEPKATPEPAAGGDRKAKVREAKADLKRELAERGATLARGYSEAFAVEEMVENDMTAKEFFANFDEDELKTVLNTGAGSGKPARIPAARLPEPEAGREETKVTPEPRTPRSDSASARAAATREARDARGGNRVAPNLPGFGGKQPSSSAPKAEGAKAEAQSLADVLNMGSASSTIASRLETWRNQMSDKVKGAPAKWKKLESQLKAIKDDDDTARKLKVIDVMEQFAKDNGLEREDSRFFGSLRFRVRPKTKTDPDGFDQPRQPQKPKGKAPRIGGERDWRTLGKSNRFPVEPRRFPVE